MKSSFYKRCCHCLAGVAALFLVLAPAQLFAQGCALCYTQAASSTQRFIAALRSGILILIIPPMFLSAMFTVMAYRRRNTFADELPLESQLNDADFDLDALFERDPDRAIPR